MILIKNTTIVTPDDTINGNILINENRVEAIGNSAETGTSAEFVIDGSGKIAMPGLVNTHAHVSMTLLRGYGEDLRLQEWLKEKIWPAEAKQTQKEVRAAAMLAFCEMIHGGTTTFADMCIFDTKEIFHAANTVGLRGIISRAGLDFGARGKDRAILKELGKTLEYGTDILLPSVAAHAAYSCSEELLIKTKELARKHSLKCQIHVSETRKEVFDVLKKTGKYPVEFLESIGLLDSDSIFSHCGWLTKREISMLGKNRVSIASCPVSNLKLATGGIAQLAELDNAGANVALGTDSSASNNSLDMFQTMKFASLLQKHHYWKADAIATKRCFDFATANGAKALGFDSGAIKPGKLADIVLLERGANMHPENNLIANLVYSAGPQNVSDVIINGRIVMENRKILTLEEADILENAESLSLKFHQSKE